MDEGVTIDISKHSGSGGQAQKDDSKGYYYTSSSGGRVNLTDEWYPDPEGTYRKLTHGLKGEYKIGNIKEVTPQNGFPSLDKYSSVSVFFWSEDSTCSTPLLIQLGDGDTSVYYTSAAGNSNWTNVSISEGNFRKEPNKQNCIRNKAHTFNISEKNGYQCPNCTGISILIISQHEDNYDYYAHYVLASRLGSFSTTSFKDDKNWQLGLPSVKNVQSISVYWTKSGGKPLLIHYEQGFHERSWFRRNTTDGSTWSEIGKADPNLPEHTSDDGKIKKLLEEASYYPLIIPDLFMPADAHYPDGNMSINITVRNAPLGNGYWKYKHSLRGGLFKLKGVEHNGNVLDGITPPDYILGSITAFYQGDDPYSLKNLIMVELEKRGTASNDYLYYIRQENSQNSWTLLGRQEKTGKLENDELTNQLNQLKNELNLGADEDVHPSADPQKQVIINAVGGTVGGLVVAGALVALVKVFWPAIVASFSAL
ncbi:hypothetical protein BEWA_045440 [Theileria equi strain WA]|uniref:Uncharacterized protein n=1 Tax=Theileria equi strain WA TaxID=1537102 RepID=L1LA26_THEEQ|nr:hypothetical protein BEWA_045440 [Theileria equi strain WA]EKX72080.1 hypothetical protein BEWA_045440 [Theileria equi strain WA]|eukprot:XP_004831532.1 hypothetical protein BEWA_045440 [Theileria equi strain WA]